MTAALLLQPATGVLKAVETWDAWREPGPEEHSHITWTSPRSEKDLKPKSHRCKQLLKQKKKGEGERGMNVRGGSDRTEPEGGPSVDGFLTRAWDTGVTLLGAKRFREGLHTG